MPRLARSGALQGFVELCRELSVSPEHLLAQAQILPEQIENEEDLIALESVVSLLEAAAEATCCPHFGLELAARQKTDFMGLVGILMESSPDLRWVLREAMRYFRLHVQGVDWHLNIGEEVTVWSIVFDLPASIPHRQCTELGLGQAHLLLRTLTDKRWRPQRICLRHRKPEDAHYYERYFNAPVEFNAECDGLSFRSDTLTLPVSGHDARVYQALSQYAELLSDEVEENLPAQVRGLIRRLLPRSHCSIEVIASSLNCDKRTLQRNLKRDGTSYQGLLDEVRHSLAADYLKNSSLTLTNIAGLLGYDEFSSFSRAFKRDFGLSPSEWRKQNVCGHGSGA